MLSRREVLITAAAASAAAVLRPWTTELASASQPGTPVKFEVPAGACDCHVHVFWRSPAFSVFAVTYLHAGAVFGRGVARIASGAAPGARGGREIQACTARIILARWMR